MNGVAIYSLLACLSTLAGGSLPLRHKTLSRKSIWRFLSLGSGLLLSVCFMALAPEAFPRDPLRAGWGALAAFALLFSLESYTLMHSCPEYLEECPIHIVGWMALVALGGHSFLDGFHIAVAFQAADPIGPTASLALSLHKFADGLTLVALFSGAGFSFKGKVGLLAGLASLTPLGAWISQSQIQNFSPAALAGLIGFTTGSFLYIAAADILPRIHRLRDSTCLLLFVAGLFSVALLRWAI